MIVPFEQLHLPEYDCASPAQTVTRSYVLTAQPGIPVRAICAAIGKAGGFGAPDRLLRKPEPVSAFAARFGASDMQTLLRGLQSARTSRDGVFGVALTLEEFATIFWPSRLIDAMPNMRFVDLTCRSCLDQGVRAAHRQIPEMVAACIGQRLPPSAFLGRIEEHSKAAFDERVGWQKLFDYLGLPVLEIHLENCLDSFDAVLREMADFLAVGLPREAQNTALESTAVPDEPILREACKAVRAQVHGALAPAIGPFVLPSRNTLEELDALSEYAERSERFWKAQPAVERGDSRCVVVETFNREHTYIVPQLFLAKYLQRALGARLIALTDPSRFPEPPGSRKLLSAFGAEVLQLPERSRVHPATNQVVRRLATTGGDLPWLLQDLSVDGIQIGDLVYDSYVRYEPDVTVRRMETRVVDGINESLNLLEDLRARFRELPVEAFVTGHRTYHHRGVPNRFFSSAGADVYVCSSSSHRVRLRRYPAGDPVKRGVMVIDRSLADSMSAEQIERVRRLGYEDYQDRKAGRNVPGRYTFRAYAADRRRAAPSEVLDAVGIPSRSYTAVVFSHVLADDPHGTGWGAYPDFAIWLERTLQVASEVGDVNWLVKLHPDNGFYRVAHLERDLVGRFLGLDNIAVLPEDLHQDSVLELADVAVTMRGTVAPEAVLSGVPAICCAEAPYSDWGFVEVHRTAESYERRLRRIRQLPKPDARAKDEAALFNGLSALSWVPSAFTTPVESAWLDPPSLSGAEKWRRAAELLDRTRLEEDELFHALQPLMAGRAEKALRRL